MLTQHNRKTAHLSPRVRSGDETIVPKIAALAALVVAKLLLRML